MLHSLLCSFSRKILGLLTSSLNFPPVLYQKNCICDPEVIFQAHFYFFSNRNWPKNVGLSPDLCISHAIGTRLQGLFLFALLFSWKLLPVGSSQWTDLLFWLVSYSLASLLFLLLSKQSFLPNKFPPYNYSNALAYFSDSLTTLSIFYLCWCYCLLFWWANPYILSRPNFPYHDSSWSSNSQVPSKAFH